MVQFQCLFHAHRGHYASLSELHVTRIPLEARTGLFVTLRNDQQNTRWSDLTSNYFFHSRIKRAVALTQTDAGLLSAIWIALDTVDDFSDWYAVAWRDVRKTVRRGVFHLTPPLIITNCRATCNTDWPQRGESLLWNEHLSYRLPFRRGSDCSEAQRIQLIRNRL